MLTINISEVIWTVINFLILLFLLNRLLFKPILGVMDKRREKIDGLHREAEALRRSVDEEEKAADDAVRASRIEAGQAIDAAARDHREALEKAVSDARRRSLEKREEADEAMRLAGENAGRRLEASADELASVLASRMLDAAAG